MKPLVWTVLGMALLATPALARETCQARPAPTAVQIPSASMERDLVTLMSLGPALEEKPLQRKALLKAKASCEHPSLEVGGQSYAVFETAADADGPVMLVGGVDPEAPIFFVAPFLDITPLLMPDTDDKAGKTQAATHLLGVSTKTGSSVLRIYVGQPDAATVLVDALATLEGRASPLVTRDARGKKININIRPNDYKGS